MSRAELPRVEADRPPSSLVRVVSPVGWPPVLGQVAEAPDEGTRPVVGRWFEEPVFRGVSICTRTEVAWAGDRLPGPGDEVVGPGAPLWTPPRDVRRSTVVGRYLSWLARTRPRSSTPTRICGSGRSTTWRGSGPRCGRSSTSGSTGPTTACSRHAVHARHHVGSPALDLNYAERALATTGDGVAVVARSQSRPSGSSPGTSCADQVARCRAGLASLGVRRGDRVVAYLPNGPEALVAFLATASLGAIWASCPPEFGRPERDRPVRPARSGRAPGHPGLPLRRQADRPADEVATIVDALPTVRVGGGRRPRTGTTSCPSRPSWPSSRCPSTTPSTCCSPRAPPDRPRRSCTGTAASCSST